MYVPPFLYLELGQYGSTSGQMIDVGSLKYGRVKDEGCGNE